METLIEAIRHAVAGDANAESRAAGAQACRTILAALEANAGEPFKPLAHAPAATTQVQAIVGTVRATPLDQLLDLAIAKLKAALPDKTELPLVQAVRIPLAPVAQIGGQSS